MHTATAVAHSKRLFIPITKVDRARREVWGTATAQVEDRTGETLHYAKSKPYFEEWSNTFADVTAGKSLGNLRAMHDSTREAGKLISINFLDEEKRIDIGAKVIEREWNNVEEGVFTGFSIGGDYIGKPWIEDGIRYYVAAPSEISLVDYPALAAATFTLVKGDGSMELRKFHPPPHMISLASLLKNRPSYLQLRTTS